MLQRFLLHWFEEGLLVLSITQSLHYLDVEVVLIDILLNQSITAQTLQQVDGTVDRRVGL